MFQSQITIIRSVLLTIVSYKMQQSVGGNLPTKRQNTSKKKIRMNKHPYQCAILGVFNNLREVFKMGFEQKLIRTK
jgi:hypothetical protein